MPIDTSALDGDPKPLLKAFGDAVDYACSPYNDKWSNIYTRKSDQSTTASDSHTVDVSQKNSANWINQTSKDFKEKFSTDINKGYFRCGVRLTNVGKTGVDIKDPLFAIYFVSPEGRYTAGTARAFQDKPDSDETVRIGAGKSADFQLNLENQDYINLIQKYACATGVVLELQDVTTTADGKAISLDEVIQDKRESSVFVRMLSDGRSYEKYVSLGNVDEISPTDLLNALDLRAKTNKIDDPITFWVTAIDPEENINGGSKLSDLKPMELTEWRKWMILVSDRDGQIIPDFKASDKLKKGYSITFIRLNAKDVLGNQYHPVIYSKKDVDIIANKPIDLIPIDLKAGDIICFKNLRVTALKGDKIKYIKRNITGSLNSSIGLMEFFALPNNSYGLAPCSYSANDKSYISSYFVDGSKVRIKLNSSLLPTPMEVGPAKGFWIANNTLDPKEAAVVYIPKNVSTYDIDYKSIVSMPDFKNLPGGISNNVIASRAVAKSLCDTIIPPSNIKISSWYADKGDQNDLSSATFSCKIERVDQPSDNSKWLLSYRAKFYKPFIMREPICTSYNDVSFTDNSIIFKSLGGTPLFITDGIDIPIAFSNGTLTSAFLEETRWGLLHTFDGGFDFYPLSMPSSININQLERLLVAYSNNSLNIDDVTLCGNMNLYTITGDIEVVREGVE